VLLEPGDRYHTALSLTEAARYFATASSKFKVHPLSPQNPPERRVLKALRDEPYQPYEHTALAFSLLGSISIRASQRRLKYPSVHHPEWYLQRRE
jgi:hypothetical protein